MPQTPVKSPESLFGGAPQPNPELEAYLAQGYSEYDAQMMLESGIAPDMAGAYPVIEQASESQFLSPQELEERQRIATELFEKAETAALEKANRDATNGVSLFEAAEKAEHDQHVEEAEKLLQAVFGGQTQKVEEQAIKHSIEASPVSSEERDVVAATVAAGNSPLELLKKDAVEEEAVVPLAELKDKVDGKAQYYIDKTARDTRTELKGYGFRATGLDKLGNELVQASGEELTNAEGVEHAMDETIGTELIRALRDGKPKPSKELRQHLNEIRKNPGDLRDLARAVASGHASKGLRRRAGHRFRHQSNH